MCDANGKNKIHVFFQVEYDCLIVSRNLCQLKLLQASKVKARRQYFVVPHKMELVARKH